MMELVLGAQQIGLYLTPINHHLVGPEIAYIVSDSDAKVLVGHERFAGELDRGRGRGELPRGPPLRHRRRSPGWRPYAELTDGQPDTRPRTASPVHADALHVGHHRDGRRA